MAAEEQERVPERQPPNQAPLLGLHLLEYLLSAGTKAANLVGSDARCICGYLDDSNLTHAGQKRSVKMKAEGRGEQSRGEKKKALKPRTKPHRGK